MVSNRDGAEISLRLFQNRARKSDALMKETVLMSMSITQTAYDVIRVRGVYVDFRCKFLLFRNYWLKKNLYKSISYFFFHRISRDKLYWSCTDGFVAYFQWLNLMIIQRNTIGNPVKSTEKSFRITSDFRLNS